MKKAWTVILIAALLLFNFLGVAGPAYAARPAAKAAQAADELLRMMPESNAVVVINVAQLSVQAQALLAKDGELASKYQSHLNQFTAETGVNVQAVEQVIAGFSFDQSGSHSRPVLMLAGAFDQEQILARLAAGSGNKWKAKKYKGQRIYLGPNRANAKSESRPAIAFFDDQSKVAFGSNADVRRVIDARAGNRSSVAENAALMSALHQTSAAASIRFAFVIPEEIRQRLRTSPGVPAFLRPLASINEVMGSVDLGDNGLQASASLITSSAAEAASLVTLINQGLTLAKLALGNYPGGELIVSILNGASVSQVGNVVNLAASVPAELIRRLIVELRDKGFRL
ncbi:MAG TPA: hypothetical protein VNI02_09535 [Blastocatellia bacterium]|jgi:hypothetical protein|nr:hypothetical protein [Blastocatellia bacterium]